MLDKSTILQVLRDWSFWENRPAPSIKRKVFAERWEWSPDLIWVIQGVRRGGKSTLLSQMIDHFELNPKRCFFANFEDPRLSENLNDRLLDKIVECAEETIKGFSVSDRLPLYFFFDEIQNVSLWERWLHRQVERPKNRHFVITGSNSSLLAGDLATALTGRHQTLELFPFDFSEFRSVKPESTLEDFLHLGGFPRVATIANPEALLREYFTDIIERDVRKRVEVRMPRLLTQLVKAVYESLATETSLRKLAKQFETTADTVHSYINAYQACYLCLECPFFSFSERKRVVHPSKYYPIDTGLHRAIVTRTGADRGKYLETVVYHLLRKKYGAVYYWRGRGEVDFVVQDGSDILPFQVSWEGEKERHSRAIRDFELQYPKAKKVTLIGADNFEQSL